MNTCFLCTHVMVPDVPATCRNACLRNAYDVIQFSASRDQLPLVADYEIRLFQLQKICLIRERYDRQNPKISLTNSIETAIVQICTKYGLCPASWTFVEYANMGTDTHSYQEYDLVVLTNDTIDWRYLWHSDCRTETEPYSDSLLIRRVEQYRNGMDSVL